MVVCPLKTLIQRDIIRYIIHIEKQNKKIRAFRWNITIFLGTINFPQKGNIIINYLEIKMFLGLDES